MTKETPPSTPRAGINNPWLDSTPPKITKNDILEASLGGIFINEDNKKLLLEKATESLPKGSGPHTSLAPEDNVYSKNHAIGECHDQVAPKRLLIESITKYKEEGYGILFLEHLQYDKHQEHLDKFFETKEMPKELKTFLSAQDRGHAGLSDPDKEYNYTKIVEAAVANGIRVVSLDTSLSYSFQDGEERSKAFSLTASKIIEREANGEKWVALMGNAHNHISPFGQVPGISNLMPNTIAVNVLEREKTTSISRDTKTKVGEHNIHSDILVQVHHENKSSLNIDLNISQGKEPHQPNRLHLATLTNSRSPTESSPTKRKTSNAGKENAQSALPSHAAIESARRSTKRSLGL